MNKRAALPLALLPFVFTLVFESAFAQVDAARGGGGRVVLFDRANFRGESIALEPGDEIANLADVRFSSGQKVNDAVSSILVERGASVTISTDSRFRGETLRLEASVENLSALARARGGNWNDTISAVRVEGARGGRVPRRGGERDPHIVVYKDSNFRGDSLEIFAGETFDNLSRAQFDGGSGANDEISSIRVVGAARARVASDSRFRGDSLEITSDVADLKRVPRSQGRSNWNDVISSIEVVRASVIDGPGGGGRPPQVDPDAVIRNVFSELLARAPTSAELSAYRRRFVEQRWSERDLRADIERSREFRLREIDAIITRSYRDILGRDPDPGGLAAYRAAFLEEGWNEARLRDTLRRSAEYRDRLLPSPATNPGKGKPGQGAGSADPGGKTPK